MRTKVPVLEIFLILSSVFLFTNKNVSTYIPLLFLGAGVFVYLVRLWRIKELKDVEGDEDIEQSSDSFTVPSSSHYHSQNIPPI